MSSINAIDIQVGAGGKSRLGGIEELVERHTALVKRIAYHLIARLPASVDVEDLIQSGIIGLLEAARNYDDCHGASFETYAGIRIRGAMIDHMRPSDWTPRSVVRKSRELAKAIQSIEWRQGREARDDEIMQEMDMDTDTYYATLRDVASARLLSFDALTENEQTVFTSTIDGNNSPEINTLEGRFRDDLAVAIDRLPEREGMVLSLYYDDELNLREIGEVLGITESRVCQIHAKAVARLKLCLSDWYDNDSDELADANRDRKMRSL